MARALVLVKLAGLAGGLSQPPDPPEVIPEDLP